jgi:hypothetical protein
VVRAVAVIVALAFTLASETRKPYTPREKAFFADAASVQFVRPGLIITVNSAMIVADGTITVVYTLTDPKGLPLDAAGITTPGTMKIDYIAAVLPQNQDEIPPTQPRPIRGLRYHPRSNRVPIQAASLLISHRGNISTSLPPRRHPGSM